MITSTAVSGPHSASASLGPITVEQQDDLGNPVNAPSDGTTVNLSSSSAGTKVFAKTRNGASVTSVTISAGASSVSFFHGDTSPGHPVITAAGSLRSDIQTEDITA